MAKKEPEDEYEFAFELRSEKAIVKVYRPILTEEEQERRMEEIKKATYDFWVAYYKKQALKEREARKAALGSK
jgi:hypothetical protein